MGGVVVLVLALVLHTEFEFSSLTDSQASEGLNPVSKANLITVLIRSGNTRIISFTI
jgi:hypothetical protein